MEAGSLNDGTLADHVNEPRLREYVDMLKFGIVPRLSDVIDEKPLALTPSQEYATYWALAFALLYNASPAIQEGRRAWFTVCWRLQPKPKTTLLRPRYMSSLKTSSATEAIPIGTCGAGTVKYGSCLQPAEQGASIRRSCGDVAAYAPVSDRSESC